MDDLTEGERVERITDELLRQRGFGARQAAQSERFDVNAEIAAMQKGEQQ